jgi:hypothetical protein
MFQVYILNVSSASDVYYIQVFSCYKCLYFRGIFRESWGTWGPVDGGVLGLIPNPCGERGAVSLGRSRGHNDKGGVRASGRALLLDHSIILFWHVTSFSQPIDLTLNFEKKISYGRKLNTSIVQRTRTCTSWQAYTVVFVHRVIRVCLVGRWKVFDVTSDVSWDVERSYMILIKKTNYITRLENRKTSLLSLIKSSLAHVCYCSANHGLIRLKRFVSWFSTKLCN